jgi:hypothetical protein
MAFGQASGPPATGKQVRELLDLLEAAGHSDFRDARGPMGFNQRQASGKFTRDEAQAFIDQLEQEAYAHEAPPTPPPPPPPAPPPAASKPRAATRPAPPARPSSLVALSDAELLAEVRRRGLTLDP